jgi:peptidoglycan/xylan/chitin deacetylase (PgdA/CDA1 family)
VGDDARTLIAANTPAAFWRLLAEPQPGADEWAAAVSAAAPVLPPAARTAGDDIETLLAYTLGEAQFGEGHWQLSTLRRLYYAVKPMLPRRLTRRLRQLQRPQIESGFSLGWPIESRYADFLYDVVRELLRLTGRPAFPYIHFWPDGLDLAFVLTHDVETADGQRRIPELADLDAGHGFRSSFNFVPERYPLDWDLMAELRRRGFEVGVHGLTHDGNLFRSYGEFTRRAHRINQYVRAFEARGFRAPLMHRNPVWMQALEIDYDLSFFDTDPYEPIPGGTMSIWPFQLGRFVELPYTLVQDYTLTSVLKESTPRLWLEKVDFIERHGGMALVNTHPDYLKDRTTRQVYTAFLDAMRSRSNLWNPLPGELAQWWRARGNARSVASLPGAVQRTVSLSASGSVTLAA